MASLTLRTHFDRGLVITCSNGVPSDALEIPQCLITLFCYSVKLLKEAVECFLIRRMISHIWSGMSRFHSNQFGSFLLSGNRVEWMLSFEYSILLILLIGWQPISNLFVVHVFVSICCSCTRIAAWESCLMSNVHECLILSMHECLISCMYDWLNGTLLYSHVLASFCCSYHFVGVYDEQFLPWNCM